MKEKKAALRRAENIMAEMAKKSAKLEANTACPILHYQPKEPQEVKSLRKF